MRYIYLYMFSEELNLVKSNMKLKMIINWISNEYQMAIVQPGFGFICETNGGKVLLEESLSPHSSNMWDIIICINNNNNNRLYWIYMLNLQLIFHFVHMISKGLKWGKENSIRKLYIKWQLSNLDLASYVEPMVLHYCLGISYIHTTEICEIYLFAYDVWGVEIGQYHFL